MNWVEIAAIATVVTAPLAIPRFYLYLKDRWVTDLTAQQKALEETTVNVPGSTINPRVSSVQCYPPRRRLKRWARLVFWDGGYTQAEVVLPDTAIKEEYWDGVEKELEKNGITVRDYGPDYDSGGSYITIEMGGFDSKVFENKVSDMTQITQDCLRILRLQEIPKR